MPFKVNYFTPFIDRFVYGLYYPAILGANIVLLTEALHNGQFQGRIWEVIVPWTLMLLLFILDFVVTAPFSDNKPPVGSVLLSSADTVSATLFLFIHVEFGFAAISGELGVDAWSSLWWIFWLLHYSMLLWCVISFRTARQRFLQTPTEEKIKHYKWLIGVVVGEITIQMIVIFLVSRVLLISQSDHLQFSVAAVLAIVGWIGRRYITQYFETEYALWE